MARSNEVMPRPTPFDDVLLIRELWAKFFDADEWDGVPITKEEIAEKFGVHVMTVYRILDLTDEEVEWRRRRVFGRNVKAQLP